MQQQQGALGRLLGGGGGVDAKSAMGVARRVGDEGEREVDGPAQGLEALLG